MARRQPNRKVRDYRRMPRRLALGYAVAGGAWVLFSDTAARWLTADAYTLSLVQTYKGWFFVLATALLLYFLLRLYTAKSYQLMSQLIDAETRFRQFFETVPDVLITVKLPGLQLSFASPAATAATGYTSEDLTRQPGLWLERVVGGPTVADEIRRQLEDDGSFSVEYQFRRKDDSLRWIRCRGRLSGSAGADTVFGIMTDITEIKNAQRQAVESSLRDPLTGLLTPPAFSLALDTLINGVYKQDVLLSCGCLGLDDFERLRVQRGDRAVEELLVRIASHLLDALRSKQIIGTGDQVLVARAEDRFLFVMPERTVGSMMSVAEHLLSSMDEALAGDRRLPPRTARLGIASHPLPGEDAGDFVADAMEALAAARADTHTRITLYNVLEREQLTEETLRLQRGGSG